MKRLASVLLGLFTCFCLLIASERLAFGYVDPGSGLLALQSIASVAAAFGYFMRRRIFGFFSRKKNDADLPIAAKKSNSANAA